MATNKHHINLYFQTPNVACGPTAFAMQLSALGYELSPEEVNVRAQSYKRPSDTGYTSAELATFAISLGLQVDFYSYDGRVLDYSWQGLDATSLRTRLEVLCESLRSDNAIQGARFRYAQGYLRFITSGGSLHIRPFPRASEILNLLDTGPLKAGVAYNVLTGEGKRSVGGTLDPYGGGFGTHSVLIYGHSDERAFLVADPAPGRGASVIEADNLVAAIAAAQIENDNSLFQIKYARREDRATNPVDQDKE
jgi:hypothetical protein